VVGAWKLPGGLHTDMIDLALVNRLWKTAVWICRTFHQATEISVQTTVYSDVQTVVALDIMQKQQQQQQQRHEPRSDIDALANATVPEAFKIHRRQCLKNNQHIHGYKTSIKVYAG